MSTEVKLDEARRRVLVTVLPGPETTTVADTALSLTRDRPALGAWDWVIDTRNPHTKATLEEVEAIAAAFNAVGGDKGHTIFVSHDPVTYQRCALMQRKFNGRRHLVARSPLEAERLLPLPPHEYLF